MFSSPNTLVTSNPEWMKLLNTPRAYQLLDAAENKEETERTFYVMGCAGDLEGAQKQVAELMHQIAQAKRKPFAIIMLGDNFYKDTLLTPNDLAFKKNFYDVYHQAALEGICGVPFFVILGNHDHNLHYLWSNRGDIDLNPAGMQVMHTYMDEKGELDPRKQKLFQAPSLTLSQLPKWNMPSRFYLLRYQEVEFYFLDSNTYLKDYLRSRKNPQEENNQALWLEREFAKYPQRTKLLFLHHALATAGKRHNYTADSSDTRIYLTVEEIAELKALKIDAFLGGMLKSVLALQKLSFATVFTAHDHAMYYYCLNTGKQPFCQVVSGGGGGKLQTHESYQPWKAVPAFIKEHGFVAVTVDIARNDKPLRLDFCSVNTINLRFTSQKAEAIQEEALAEDVKKLRDVVLNAYENYLNYLSEKQSGKLKTGIKSFLKTILNRDVGIEGADNLRNYFNRYEKIQFNDAANYVIKTFGVNPMRTDNSFFSYFENALIASFQIKWESFIENPAVILEKSLLMAFSEEENSSKPAESPGGLSSLFLAMALAGSKKSTPPIKTATLEVKQGQSSAENNNALSPIPLSIGSPIDENDSSSLTGRLITHFFPPKYTYLGKGAPKPTSATNPSPKNASGFSGNQ